MAGTQSAPESIVALEPEVCFILCLQPAGLCSWLYVQSPTNKHQEACALPNLLLTMDIVLESACARKTRRGGWRWEDWVRKREIGVGGSFGHSKSRRQSGTCRREEVVCLCVGSVCGHR